MNKQNEPIGKLINEHFDKIKILEKISLLIFFIGFALFLLKQPDYNFILIIGTGLTALTYFFCAYKHFEVENHETTNFLNSVNFINFVLKLTFWALAVSYISLLDLVIPFENPAYIIGGGTLSIVLIISLITAAIKQNAFYNPAFFIRIIIPLLLIGYMASTKL